MGVEQKLGNMGVVTTTLETVVNWSRTNAMWDNGPYDDTGFTAQVSTWAFVQVEEDPPDASCGYTTNVAGS